MKTANTLLTLAAVAALAACGAADPDAEGTATESRAANPAAEEDRETIWDLFDRGTPGQVGEVNRYIWNAALDTLSFLPVESVDPFTGVIVMGYGTPPGGGTAYRATILIDDPALDARSLNLALQTRRGPASAETVRAVEDAILTRARQLRIADARF